MHNGSPQSGEVSPVSQMSPYNMSPLSASPVGSAGVSPIAGNSCLGPGAPGMTSVLAKIHSRRFREYVISILPLQLYCATPLHPIPCSREHLSCREGVEKLKSKVCLSGLQMFLHCNLYCLRHSRMKITC